LFSNKIVLGDMLLALSLSGLRLKTMNVKKNIFFSLRKDVFNGILLSLKTFFHGLSRK